MVDRVGNQISVLLLFELLGFLLILLIGLVILINIFLNVVKFDFFIFLKILFNLNFLLLFLFNFHSWSRFFLSFLILVFVYWLLILADLSKSVVGRLEAYNHGEIEHGACTHKTTEGVGVICLLY